MKISFALLISFLMLISSCSYTPSELKSPCVSGDGGNLVTPCVKRSVNSHWLG